MENQLPLCLKNVSYKSVSKYSWKGDLVIAQGTIYFLPTRDLELERDKALSQIPIGGAVGLLIQVIVRVTERSVNNFQQKNRSYLIEQGLLSQEKINELELRQKIEKHLVEIKGHGSSFAALPRPVKLIASNVKNITLKSSVLVIETDVDKYFFKFPRKYNTQIRSALFMAQFKV